MLKPLIAVFLLLALGFAMGKEAGNLLVTRFLAGKGASLFLLYRPAYEYMYVISLLGSDDGLKRIAGYYSLLENRKVDAEFLAERYRKEDLPFIKSAIVWILGQGGDITEAEKFFSEIYPSASHEIRVEMLKALKRRDEGLFRRFQKAVKADAKDMRDVRDLTPGDIVPDIFRAGERGDTGLLR